MTDRRRYLLALQMTLMTLEDLPITEADRPATWSDAEWFDYLEWKNGLVEFDPKAIHLEAISKPRP